MAQSLTTGFLGLWSLSLSEISSTQAGVGFQTKKSLRHACLAGNLWPRMEVLIKGAKSGKVFVLNPFVAAWQGSQFRLSLDLMYLVNDGFYLAVCLGLLNDIGH